MAVIKVLKEGPGGLPAVAESLESDVSQQSAMVDKVVNPQPIGNDYVAGSVVRVSDTVNASGGNPTVDLAQADSAANSEAIAVLLEGIAAVNGEGNAQYGGPVRLPTATWDAVTNQTGGLTRLAKYFLDPANPGFLTTVATNVPGEIRKQVGIAATEEVLIFDPKPGVLQS